MKAIHCIRAIQQTKNVPISLIKNKTKQRNKSRNKFNKGRQRLKIRFFSLYVHILRINTANVKGLERWLNA